jgi:hypothetical protein
MKTAVLISTSLALALTGALLAAAPAEARKAQRQFTVKRHIQPSRTTKPAFKAAIKRQRAPIVNKPLQRKLITKQPLIQKKMIVKQPMKPLVGKGPLATKAPAAALLKKRNPNLVFGRANMKNLPVHKAVAGTATLAGRVGLTRAVQPKLSLMKGPKPQFSHRFAPFVQRHWKKAFVWVAVAGLGYLTIPEIYYDRFLGYVSVDDPDYDACIGLLSLAALEEEEELVRVRKPMPAAATYRYTAKVAPEPAGASTSACSFEPFVERTWSRPFAWVQIPQVGNVTVPEDYYDRFYGFVSGQPADYPSACAVLVEAAAMDTVTLATPERNRLIQ